MTPIGIGQWPVPVIEQDCLKQWVNSEGMHSGDFVKTATSITYFSLT